MPYNTRRQKRNVPLPSTDTVVPSSAKRIKCEEQTLPVTAESSAKEKEPLKESDINKPLSPVKKQDLLVKKQTSPVKKHAPLIKEQASPVKEQASPVKKQTSPFKEQASATKIKSETPLTSSQTEDEEESEDEIENELNDYEKKRLKNLKDNAEFFSKLGINELKKEMRRSTETAKPSGRGIAKHRKKSPPPPRRASLRIRRIDPDGTALPPRPPSPEPIPEHPRKLPGPLPMEEHLLKDDTEGDHLDLLDKIKGLTKGRKVSTLQEMDSSLASFMKGFGNIKLRSDGVAKVVPDRVFSLAIHPSEDKVIVAAGGKWGAIGIWDVLPGREHATDGVVTYTPHSRPVNCLHFPCWSPYKLYSSSYDGTLRCADIEKGVFDDIYSTPEEDDLLLKNFSFMSEDTLLVSQQDGTVALVDTRTKRAEAVYRLHMKSLRTVSVHPVDKHILATGSTDGTVRLWDQRTLKNKNNREIDVLQHSKGVSSAYFSPVTGKYVLSTSNDDRITVHDTSDLKKNIDVLHTINHDNHVGRWLTPFRAVWHPSREDVFVVGSMKRPRRIQLYKTTGAILKEYQSEDNLGSVCSLNVIHPSQNILAGANSSGRLHVFM